MAHAIPLPSRSRIVAPPVGQPAFQFAVRGVRPDDHDFPRPMEYPEVLLDFDEHLRGVVGQVIAEARR